MTIQNERQEQERYRIAKVRLKKVRGIFGEPFYQWVINKCPFCGESHWHFAGYRRKYAHLTLGIHESHCGYSRLQLYLLQREEV